MGDWPKTLGLFPILKPVIDSRFSLADIREAQARVETRRARGKVIVTID